MNNKKKRGFVCCNVGDKVIALQHEHETIEEFKARVQSLCEHLGLPPIDFGEEPTNGDTT